MKNLLFLMMLIFPSLSFAQGIYVDDSWFHGSGKVTLTTSTDNVGIGSAFPGQKMDVQGTVRATGFIGNVVGNVTGSSGSTIGNAATVTTNANLTGVIISNGNATSIGSQTGTGTKFVVDTSPTLVTPTIGAATATSINKMAITAPATSSTLAIANAKTLTVNNTITLAGTDGITETMPSTSFTTARTDAANTFTGHQTIEGVTSTGATGTGNLVFATAPTITLANATGLPLGTGVTGILPSANGGTGINNSSSITLGSSNVNLATLGTGIVKNTTTTGLLSNAVAADIIALFSTCSGSQYLGADGSCHSAAGAGTVTSIVAGTGLTGGTITTSGTIALDLTNSNTWSGLTNFTSNVGISSAAPGQKLDVQGTVRATNFIGSGAGLTGTASSLTANTVTTNANLTGDVISSGNATTLKNTGTAGTYRSTTFDAQGRETSGTNPTTFSAYAISDTSANLAAALSDEVGTGFAVFNANPNFTGNVGIGSTAPGQMLDVQGTIRMKGFNLPVSPTAGWVLTSDANGNGTWAVVTGSGTVNSGTINDVGFYNASGTVISGASNLFSNGTNVGIGTTNFNNAFDVVGGVGIGVSGSSGYVITAVPAGSLIVQNNVGIGSQTPGQILDVQGTTRSTQFIAGTGGITLGGVNNTSWPSGSGTVNSGSANQVATYAGAGTTISGSSSLVVVGSNIGIGSAAPGQILDVGGTQRWTGSGNGAFGIGTLAPSGALEIEGGNVGIGTFNIFTALAIKGVVSEASNPPTISSCGTSPNGSATGNDQNFTITVGGTAATACTVTFIGTYTLAHCVYSEQTMSIVNAITFTESGSGLTFSQTGLTGNKIDVNCGFTQ